ncbi:MAG: germination protein YpeB [Clostridia bacterium]|nr:germination protein YpeB [Clostridia bacterium]
MDYQEKLEYDRRRFIDRWIYTVLIIALIAIAWWGIGQYRESTRLKISLGNQYTRSFHELVDYVDDIQTSLNKGMLVSSPSQMATISSEIFRKSTAAKACLSQLPVSDIQMDNTSKFLSQVGDYTYVLSQNMINNHKVSDEEYKNLESLSSYAEKLNASLTQMQNEIYSGNIDFGKLAFQSDKQFEKAVKAENNGALADLEKVEQEFQEYPSLIYDGPFSEHIQNMKPAMLENGVEISVDEAKQKAKDFLGARGDNLVFESEVQNSYIDAYSFAYRGDDGRQISISITKKNGYVIYFLDNRSVEEDKLDFVQATEMAAGFLEKKGYTYLKSSYYDKSNGIATINFAFQQGETTCYSDLIKVRVALDNGEILGMEAHGFIMNHKIRDLPSAKITEAEAREKVNSRLNIKTVNMALIPKDSLMEVYCYEFHGQFDDKNFIIYINAENGKEEKILMLIESEDGVLTI